MRRSLTALIAFFAALSLAPRAEAHRPSDAFITVDLEGTTVSGQLDLALKDLELAIGLDRDGDLNVTWGELRAKQKDVEAYAAEHLAIVADGKKCALTPLDFAVTTKSDGAFASVIFDTSCTDKAVAKLTVTYDGMFDLDAQHRGILKLSHRGEQIAHVFSSGATQFDYDATFGGPRQQLAQFGREGMRHIFRGYDHILFLIALLLPAVLRRRGKRFVPRDSLRGVLAETAKVVTAFTVAHSLSLALTSFGVVTPPPARAVEVAIAMTIFLTALNNAWPLVERRYWLVGFGFGLIHGIGYASVLRDVGLTGVKLAAPLVGFNLGVEAAQLVVIAAFLPGAFLLRGTRIYRGVFLYAGSAATGALALAWIVEQVARVQFLPF